MSEILLCETFPGGKAAYIERVKEVQRSQRNASILGVAARYQPENYLTIFESVQARARVLGACAIAIKEGTCPSFTADFELKSETKELAHV